jgi:hypothetical protein
MADDDDPLIFLEQLPNKWVFDLMQEFVYQFQSFCQFRNKVSTKTEGELVGVVHRFVVKSFNVHEQN